MKGAIYPIGVGGVPLPCVFGLAHPWGQTPDVAPELMGLGLKQQIQTQFLSSPIWKILEADPNRPTRVDHET